MTINEIKAYGWIGRAEVTGSSPVISSNHKPLKNLLKSGTFKGFLFLKIFTSFLLKKYYVSIFLGGVGVKKITQKKADNPKSDYLPKLF